MLRMESTTKIKCSGIENTKNEMIRNRKYKKTKRPGIGSTKTEIIRNRKYKKKRNDQKQDGQKKKRSGIGSTKKLYNQEKEVLQRKQVNETKLRE